MPAYLQHKGKVVRDVDWVANMFSVAPEQIQEKYRFAAWATTAHNKFTDTRIGGNWAINNPPSFTRFADPRQSALNHRSVKGTAPTGMGALYSEMLDDNAHLVHYCFGVASFKGMFSFFNGMGSVEAALYARLGRVPIAFLIGKVAGIYTAMRFLPLLLVGLAANFLLNRGSSKYYSLKPTMHSYWKRVDFIANSFAVSTNLYQRFASLDWGRKEHEAQLDPTGSTQYGYTENEHKKLVDQAYQAAPEIFRKRGGIDVYYVVNRAQSLATARRKLLDSYADKITSKEDIARRMVEFEYTMDVSNPERQTLEQLLKLVHDTPQEQGGLGNPAEQYVNEEDSFGSSYDAAYTTASVDGTEINIANQANAQTTAATTNADGTVEGGGKNLQSDELKDRVTMFSSWSTDPNTNQPVLKQGTLSKVWQAMSDAYHGSYRWVTFRVENTGSTSASFSNSSKEAEITSMINGFSSTMAGHRFTFSNGATGLPMFDTAISTVKNALLGYAAGLDAAGVISLAGSAYVDIPEHWESSSATFPTENFKMILNSPYANKLSKFLSMYIPLSCILAGALPISTGKQQYTSPYMCQVISPGRMSSKLSMIDNLNIVIGAGSMGFNQQNQPLQFDVTWSNKDMNKTMHSPIDTGGSYLNPFRAIFDDDNAFNDFLNTCSAVSMADQINPIRKLSKNIALRLNQWDSFWSVNNMTMGFFDSPLGRGTTTVATIAGLSGIPGTIIPQLNRSLIQ